MKAVQYTVPRQFVVADLPKPEPGPHQVVTRVKACGICKTNLAIHDRDFLAKSPLVDDHEFAGVINSMGSTVTEQKVGDRVTADNTELCGYCESCRSDKPLYCKNFNFHGCNISGGSVKYVLINHDKVSALSNKLPFKEVTFTESTARTIHGVDRIAPCSGDSILMFDAGSTGIILAQLLCRTGVGRMVTADLHADKLDTLRKHDFTDLVAMDKTDPSKYTVEIKAIMSKGFDVVIDATGAALVFKPCFHFVHVGSKIVAYGACAASAETPASPYDIFSQGYTILGPFAQIHCFGRALEYLESDAMQAKELTSHELPLGDYSKGPDYVVQKQARKVITHLRERFLSVC